MIIRRSALAFFIVISMLSTIRAAVKPHALFTDNMVLQRDIEVPVWGTANDGENITVQFGGQTVSTTARDGKWFLKLKPMPASSEPREMIFSSNLKRTNVLVGEVWVCAGQSNMQFPMQDLLNAALNPEQPIPDLPGAQREIATANYPMMRWFGCNWVATNIPQANCSGSWSIGTPAHVASWSAVSFLFGRELHRELKVPVGLIGVPWGGSPIQAWMSVEAQQAVPELKQLIENEKITSYHQGAGHIYNGMIAPLIPYAIRGAIWYQGEANNNPEAVLYGLQLKTMIESWRRDWNQPPPLRSGAPGTGLYFISVQMPFFGKPRECVYWPLIREGVLKSLALPNVGMAVAIDTGEEKSIHPRDKVPVGRRLAFWALANTYHKKGIVGSGPIYKSMNNQGGGIILTFDYVDGGLMAREGGSLADFEIAGADKKFIPAEAKIKGKTVVVSNPQITVPVAVRYNWAGGTRGSLYNRAGLPASPFRTDDWN